MWFVFFSSGVFAIDLSNTIGYHPDSSSRHWPTLEVVTEHLPSRLMPALYAAADAFVLPTHGEGWGLPTVSKCTQRSVVTITWQSPLAYNAVPMLLFFSDTAAAADGRG